MPSIERDGATLHYRERGQGSAVILQHPLTADARAWDAIGVPSVLETAGFRVILPDALGHGRSSEATAERAGLWSRVDDVLALADTIGLARFHYVGYSMGGWIGTGLASRAPERLSSLFVAGWDPIDGARRFTSLTDMTARRRAFAEQTIALTAKATGNPPPGSARLAGYLDTYERLFIDLPSIATLIDREFPLLLAVGADDPYADAVTATADALDVELVTIPGDHVQAFIDPNYAQSVADWLRRQK